ncbi:MAG: GGDEF domain-containing protein [Actinobacteria bacterium]|nr:GGDEF domain-containing protein [Actinomycetota bacterium]
MSRGEENQNLLGLSDVFSAFDKFQQILESLYSSLNLEEIDKKAKNLLSYHLNTRDYILLVFDPSSKNFVFACHDGFSREIAEDIVREVIKSKNTFLSSTERIFKLDIEDVDLSSLTLSTKGKFLGVLVSKTELIENIENQDYELLNLIALSILYAYNNSRLYELTRRLAVWDNKTNLYNYRYFLSRLSNEISRAKRYGRKLSLIAIDLDRFKLINQQLGHLTADKILKDIAKIIKESIRSVDIPSRFGGDEFFILLPETSLEGARVVGERLKSIVESRLFPLNGKKDRIRINLTFGVSEYENGMSAKEFLEIADKELMKAKSERR